MQWLSDNLTLRVEIEGERVTDVGQFLSLPWTAYSGTSILLNIDKPITGKVFIDCPPNFRAWIEGIQVSVEETAHFMDVFTTMDLTKYQVKLGEPGWIETSTEFSFSFHLPQKKTMFSQLWHDTYDGETFGVRHNLNVTLLRPWYVVFNEPFYASLQLFQIDSFQTEERFSKTAMQLCEVARVFEISSSAQWVEAGHPLCLSVRIEDLVKPIDFAQISLVRVEYIEDAPTEIVMGLFKVCGPEYEENEALSAKAASKSSMVITKRIDTDDTAPRSTDGIQRGSEMEMQIHLDASLAMSFDTSPLGLASVFDASSPVENAARHKEAVAMRYYLRFAVVDCEGDSIWNTMEIFVFRTVKPEFPPESALSDSTKDVAEQSTRRVSISNII